MSQLDAGAKDEATKTCTHAIQLASKHVPDRVLDLVRLQVREQHVSVVNNKF